MQTAIWFLISDTAREKLKKRFKDLAVPSRVDLESILPMEKNLEVIMREKPNPRRVD